VISLHASVLVSQELSFGDGPKHDRGEWRRLRRPFSSLAGLLGDHDGQGFRSLKKESFFTAAAAASLLARQIGLHETFFTLLPHWTRARRLPLVPINSASRTHIAATIQPDDNFQHVKLLAIHFGINGMLKHLVAFGESVSPPIRRTASPARRVRHRGQQDARISLDPSKRFDVVSSVSPFGSPIAVRCELSGRVHA